LSEIGQKRPQIGRRQGFKTVRHNRKLAAVHPVNFLSLDYVIMPG
jgi:hypothetical protein